MVLEDLDEVSKTSFTIDFTEKNFIHSEVSPKKTYIERFQKNYLNCLNSFHDFFGQDLQKIYETNLKFL